MKILATINSILFVKLAEGEIGNQAALATLTKHHRLSGLNKINRFSHGSGNWKLQIKVWQGQLLVRNFFWLADGHLLAMSSCDRKNKLSGVSYYKNTNPIIGEGNGTPLQYSCLENPLDGGAW